MTQFQKDLLALLNRHSKENDSNTPDFILADYLIGCLKTFNESVRKRELWYGRKEGVAALNKKAE